MKRFIKGLVKVAVVWTAAEFVTMWRMTPGRPSLSQFTKDYVGYVRHETPALTNRLATAKNGSDYVETLKTAFHDPTVR